MSDSMSFTKPLSRDEHLRYSRHTILPEIGIEGQQKLKSRSALVVGAGGLGSPVCLYLAAAGIGRIGIVDFDRVDESNLQRQVIHHSSDVGRPKVQSAAGRIAEINPFVKVQPFQEKLSSKNALRIVSDYDIVIDGTDNFATRYLVNDACVMLGKPNCYGSIFRFDGQASVLCHSEGPCYRCLYPQAPDPGLIPNCAEGGVLGVLPGLVGTIQATEAIKVLLGIGEPLIGRMLLIDALDMQFRQLKVHRSPDCPVCGEHRSITELIDYDQFCGGENKRPEPQSPYDIEPTELQQRLQAKTPTLVLDVREAHEYEICNLAGTLIPLADLPDRMSELDPNARIVVHCKMGGRSAKAVKQLREAGFKNVENLRGGIMAWKEQIDPTLPNY